MNPCSGSFGRVLSKLDAAFSRVEILLSFFELMTPELQRITVFAYNHDPSPEIRAFYLQMARKKKKNNRPFDMAVSDYFKGNDRLTKK